MVAIVIDTDHKMEWHSIFWLLGIAFSIAVIAVTFCWTYKPIPMVFHIVNFVLCSLLLVILNMYINNLIPWNLPQWMQSVDISMYPYTFLMPPIFHSFLALVIESKKIELLQRPYQNIVFSLLSPMFFIFFVVLVLPTFNTIGCYEYYFISFAVLFFIPGIFLMLRGFYLWYIGLSDESDLTMTEFNFVLTFPLLGLLLNSQYIWHNEYNGIFGNFSSPWFVVICILNATFMCIKLNSHPIIYKLSIVGRIITFPFTVYFALVFLPYIPLSFALILFFGAGILMLTPLVLFILHCKQLIVDFRFLKNEGVSRTQRILISTLTFIIPLSILMNFHIDKNNMNALLDYTFGQHVSKEIIDINRAKTALEMITNERSRKRILFGNNTVPYIDSYYRSLVFDNLSLPWSKIQVLKEIVNNEHKKKSPRVVTPNQTNVVIKKASSKSEYNGEFYTSTIDLEMVNTSTMNNQEYISKFYLPPGAFISDYYLFVGKTKKHGLLAEKKAAMWIYERITSQKKDPGILHYENSDIIVLKVFPFAGDEVRKTGFTIVHKEPFDYKLDEHTLHLNDSMPRDIRLVSQSHSYYIPSHVKTLLPQKKLVAYPYYVVDASQSSNYNTDAIIKAIHKSNMQLGFDDAKTKVCVANFETHHLANLESLGNYMPNQQGGFFLDKAIRDILKTQLSEPLSDNYPVIIVISDHIEKATLLGNFDCYLNAVPTHNYYYTLAHGNQFEKYSLVDNVDTIVSYETSIPCSQSVRIVKEKDEIVAYARDDENPQVINTKLDLAYKNDNSKNKWLAALEIDRKVSQSKLNADDRDALWLEALQSSFINNTMCPLTSYLVLENEAQENILKQKQDQILKGNQLLSPDQDVTNMDEPSFFVFILLIVLFLLYKKKRLKIESNIE